MTASEGTVAVRRLAPAGLERFSAYLEELRRVGRGEPPYGILEDREHSAPFEPEVRVDRAVSFENRLAAGRYLTEKLGNRPGLEQDVGLWSWLSLLWFDQVCPPRADGTRAPGRDYRHVLEPGYRYGHQHLLAGPFLVYRLHGSGAHLLLASPLHRENTFHHQIASRQAFLTNPTIMRAVHLLYFDERKRRPKRGAQDAKPRPGALRRFVEVVQQLELNYDLYDTEAQELVALLPEEFDTWKPRGLRRRP